MNNVVDKFGYFYDGRYNGAEDYELILRLLDNNFSIYIDDKIVLHYNVNDKTYDYQKLQYHLCNKLNYKYDIYNLANKHIGIYYIATGVYNKSFPDFLLSLNKPSAFIRTTNGKYKIFKNDVLVNNTTVI